MIKIDSKTYFSFELPTGNGWSDPLKEQAIYTRTLLPDNTKFIKAKTEAEMIDLIFNDATIEFSDEYLSNETKVKLKEKGIKTKEDKIKEKIK